MKDSRAFSAVIQVAIAPALTVPAVSALEKSAGKSVSLRLFAQDNEVQQYGTACTRFCKLAGTFGAAQCTPAGRPNAPGSSKRALNISLVVPVAAATAAPAAPGAAAASGTVPCAQTHGKEALGHTTGRNF